MRNLQRYWIVIYTGFLLFLFLFTPTLLVKADVGPKAGMDFYFVYPQKKVSVLEGNLLLCSDEYCNKYKQFDGALHCKSDWCTAWASSPVTTNQYVKYHKIIVTFSDGIRESNVFTKKSFQAKYEVQVENNHLIVKEKINLGTLFNPLALFCFSLAALFTILIETLVVKIYIWITKTSKSLVWYVVLANIFSLPMVWFVLSQIETQNELIYLGIAELVVFIFEALFLALFARRLGLSIKQAVLLSVVLNLVSFLIGRLVTYQDIYRFMKAG